MCFFVASFFVTMSSRSLRNGKSYIIPEDALNGVLLNRKLKALQSASSPKTRSAIDSQNEIKESISQLRIAAPATPTIVFQERASRNKNPTCLYFGVEEQFKRKFPGYLFCHACQMWEEEKRNPTSSRSKRSSKKYKCTAKHNNWICPSKKIKTYHACVKYEPIIDNASTMKYNVVNKATPESTLKENDYSYVDVATTLLETDLSNEGTSESAHKEKDYFT